MDKSKVCSAPDCAGVHFALGLCRRHYWRLKRRGSLLTRKEQGVLAYQQTCLAPDCRKRQKSSGYCHTHYVKLRRSGTLEVVRFNAEWRRKQAESHRTELSIIDDFLDPRPGHRGYYAVNVVNDVRSKALKRGLGWSLSSVEAYRLIVGPCFYCGTTPDWPRGRNGIDRKDCGTGYTPANCVSACWTCNAAKNSHSVEQFRLWAERLYEHFVKGTHG